MNIFEINVWVAHCVKHCVGLEATVMNKTQACFHGAYNPVGEMFTKQGITPACREPSYEKWGWWKMTLLLEALTKASGEMGGEWGFQRQPLCDI